MANGKDIDVRMLVEVIPSSYGDPYFHVIARPVKHVWDEHENRWSFDRGFHYDEPHYSDLRVTAQGALDRDDELSSYGWRAEYRELFSVTLGDAEKMVKVLRKIDRGLERLNADLGWPETVGQYVARVGKVLGITAFGFFPPRGEAMWASGERVRWDNAAFLNSTISQRVDELRATYAETH